MDYKSLPTEAGRITRLERIERATTADLHQLGARYRELAREVEQLRAVVLKDAEQPAPERADVRPEWVKAWDIGEADETARPTSMRPEVVVPYLAPSPEMVAFIDDVRKGRADIYEHVVDPFLDLGDPEEARKAVFENEVPAPPTAHAQVLAEAARNRVHSMPTDTKCQPPEAEIGELIDDLARVAGALAYRDGIGGTRAIRRTVAFLRSIKEQL